LVDPLQVWTTGRTVECEACGQRWRAAGQGLQPPSGPELAPEQEPPPAASPPTGASLDDESEATTSGEAEPIEVRPEPEPDAAQTRPDWHAPLRDAAPAGDAALTGELLFGKPPRRATASFASPRSGAARWLSLVFLVIIVLAAAVMFRDVIVQAFPGLAPVYASMGLLVHPAVAPRG
jgi:hypothetical protein